ncbi:hemin uptake protein HemP [Marinospirillum sp. MEB164]|uniref:Hemin uptake protein HemP n=1 Tax=Marinospirillum alkalitolerans TaxID=3123374 RepID=A0ABW8PY32_9GAMM
MQQAKSVEPRIEQNPGVHRIKRMTSQDLLQGGQQLLIEHEQEMYVLRVTRQGKLILTK